ncbi:sugar phosphate nucleotidyltransferase [Bacillus sp. 165]|uniref:sugar phosphate nucleotidyltransferase n=1 Tax=Bacillus sp. 165 TaxID=1529117 RepID=UPI001ADA836A|nr:sugar phosphate nucleotidyltransferase [Bacillus sp. 165]MBO9129634.1 NTP transferase domain-containing protein [Bacillus sp. 165]
MKGVILAGGKGTRLRPLTCNLPKPMLPLLNKPVMEYSIELLKKHGIEEIAVTVQYMSSSIKNYFGDGSRWGVKLYYFEDSPPLGTAGSIKQAEEFLDEPFLVMSGDALTDFNLSKGIDFHTSEDRLLTIFMKEVSNPLEFGLIVTDEDQHIQKYIEKPNWNEVFSNTVNTGIYMMNPSIFSYIKEGVFTDFSHDVFPLLIGKDENVYGYLCEGYWLDIGTFPQYRQAHFDLLTKKVKVPVNYTEILPSVWIGKGVTIEQETAVRGPVLIGDGAIIKAGTVIEPYTIIGQNSIICENVNIKKSILWNEVYIGKQCELTGTTIAHGTSIEDGATIYEKAVVADHCKIGKNTVIKSAVKVWPGKIINASSVVTSSIVAAQEISSSLFKRGCITGRANVDIVPEQTVRIAAAYGATFPIESKVLIASNSNIYAAFLKQVCMNGLHSAGIHTLECPEISDACFRYVISKEQVAGGIFVSMNKGEESEQITIRFYNEHGESISSRTEKEIQTIYTAEAFRHVEPMRIGRNMQGGLYEGQYVHSLLEHIQVELIQSERFHLLVNQVDSPFQETVLAFFQMLGCSLTWVYSHNNEEHIKAIIKTSGADMGIIFNDQGNTFEIYDKYGNVYTYVDNETIYIPHSVINKKGNSCYPLSLKHGPNYIISYLEEIIPHLSLQKNQYDKFKNDALYRISKLLEIISIEKLPLYTLFKKYTQFHLLRDEVICPWKEKGKVMRKLLDDFKQKQFEIVDGIKFEHQDGEWSYIVSDISQPKFIVYSQSLNPSNAKENISYFIEKIRQYQKV